MPDAVARARAHLVAELTREGRVRSDPVADALATVPRHLFLPDLPPEDAYADEAVPIKISDGVTLSSVSQPSMVAIMLEQLGAEPGDRILEIGAGAGWNAALLARIAGPTGAVTTVDIDEDLVDRTRENLAAAGVSGVDALVADGAQGHPPGAPYDRIELTVGATDLRPEWVDQLTPDGRLLLPLAIRGSQLSIAFARTGPRRLESVSVRGCAFVRLRGAGAGDSGTVPLDAPGWSVQVSEAYSRTTETSPGPASARSVPLGHSASTDAGPGSTDTVAGGREVVAGGGEAVPGTTDAISGGKQMVVGGRDATSGTTDVVPDDRDAVSDDRDAVSDDRDAVSGDRDAVSGDRDVVSGGRAPVSGGGDVVSGGRAVVSGEGVADSGGRAPVSDGGVAGPGAEDADAETAGAQPGPVSAPRGLAGVVDRALAGPVTAEIPSACPASAADVWDGLGLWCAIADPAVFRLLAEGPAAESTLGRSLLGSSAGRVAVGLACDDGVALLVIDPDRRIRGFGTGGATAAARLAALVNAWVAAGHPQAADLRIEAEVGPNVPREDPAVGSGPGLDAVVRTPSARLRIRIQ